MSADICSGNVPPSKRLPYVQAETTRHGKEVFYYRVGPGRRVRLPGAEGSAEFNDAYEQAVIYYTMLSRP
jgi:hypothetical protein